MKKALLGAVMLLGLVAGHAKAATLIVYGGEGGFPTGTDYNEINTTPSLPGSTSVSGSTSGSEGAASSSVDLAKGQLKAVASSVPPTPPEVPNPSAVGTAIFDNELVTIQGDLSDVIPTEIQMLVHVEGSLTGGTTNSGPWAYAAFDFRFGDDVWQYGIQTTTCGTNPSPGSLCGYSGSFSFTQVLTALVTDATRTLFVSGMVSAQASNGGLADVGHTISLALLLPQGLSFTSDSGVFLTDPQFTPSSVPLPAAFPLFAAGLGAMGLLSSRRRKAAVAG